MLVFICLFTVWTARASDPSDTGTFVADGAKIAVVVGIDNYENGTTDCRESSDTRPCTLQNAVNDATYIAEALHWYYDFELNDPILLDDLADEQRILNGVKAPVGATQKSGRKIDTLVIIFVGHGAPAGLLPYDAARGGLINLPVLVGAIERAKPDKAIVIADVCFSDSILKGYTMLANGSGRPRWILGATVGSLERDRSKRDPSHSPFTLELVDYLRQPDSQVVYVNQIEGKIEGRDEIGDVFAGSLYAENVHNPPALVNIRFVPDALTKVDDTLTLEDLWSHEGEAERTRSLRRFSTAAADLDPRMLEEGHLNALIRNLLEDMTVENPTSALASLRGDDSSSAWTVDSASDLELVAQVIHAARFNLRPYPGHRGDIKDLLSRALTGIAGAQGLPAWSNDLGKPNPTNEALKVLGSAAPTIWCLDPEPEGAMWRQWEAAARTLFAGGWQFGGNDERGPYDVWLERITPTLTRDRCLRNP